MCVRIINLVYKKNIVSCIYWVPKKYFDINLTLVTKLYSLSHIGPLFLKAPILIRDLYCLDRISHFSFKHVPILICHSKSTDYLNFILFLKIHLSDR